MGLGYGWVAAVLLAVVWWRFAFLMEPTIPIHCNTNIAWPTIIRVIMSLAQETTKPGANYVRIFAELIRLCVSVVITARVRRALCPETTNLSAFRAHYHAVYHLFTPRPGPAPCGVFFIRANKNIAPVPVAGKAVFLLRLKLKSPALRQGFMFQTILGLKLHFNPAGNVPRVHKKPRLIGRALCLICPGIKITF